MSGVTRMELVFGDGLRAVSCVEQENNSCNGCSFNTMGDSTTRCMKISEFGLNCSQQGIIWKVVQ